MRFTVLVLLLSLVCPRGSGAGFYSIVDYVKQFALTLKSDVRVKGDRLNKFLNEIWKLDSHRLNRKSEVVLGVDEYFHTGNKLFAKVEDNKLDDPVYKTFTNLLDNYMMKVGVHDTQTMTNTKESWLFLKTAMQTKLMNRTHQFLVDEKLAPKSKKDFLSFLYEIWFGFDRPREYHIFATDHNHFSSFEHVFVGETVGEQLQGMHNWIHFYLLEKSKAIKFHGIKRSACKHHPQFLQVEFSYPAQNISHAKTMMFVGTSPVFELAAYTAVFLMKVPGRLTLDESCTINVICLRRYHVQWRPATCYPKDKFI